MEKSLSTDQPLAAAAAHDALNRTSYPVIAAISFSHLLNDMMQSVLLAIYPLLGYPLEGSRVHNGYPEKGGKQQWRDLISPQPG